MAKKLSNIIKEFADTDIAHANRQHYSDFKTHLTSLEIDDSKLLLPIGLNYNNCLELGIFNNKDILSKLFDEDVQDLSSEQEDKLCKIIDRITEKIDYIYIPKDIDPQLFTQLERSEIQILMGESLTEIISEQVSAQQIATINSGLNNFLAGVYFVDDLKIYNYLNATKQIGHHMQ